MLYQLKKTFLAFIVLTSLSAGTFAQTSQLEQNLRRHVEYLASDKLEGRRTGEPGATLAGEYITEQFKKLKLKPGVKANGKSSYMQAFSYTPVRDPHGTPSDPTRSPATPNAKQAFNVIGILPGNDPVLKNEAIFIGAHYDHLGRGGAGSLAANSIEIHHGADDNASGTAAVIELARQFASERKNKRTIIFIAFSGEEDGLFGSKYYVNNPVWPLDKTIAMINLDMVGRLNENKLNIGGIGTAIEWKQLVEGTNLQRLTQITFVPPPDIPTPSFQLQLNEDGFGPSDHSSFYSKQIPVLFFFTGTHTDYHKPSDTAEKINYRGLSEVLYFVIWITRSIDGDAKRPTYTVTKSSNTGGRTGFSVSLGTIPSYADSTDGMELDGVRDDSPAAKAGLKKGDKVIKLAGKDIKNVYDYTAALGEMKPGEEYEVIVKRGKETIILKIIPAAAARQ
ncbi:MAG: M20/M25/M40 family metallo-hydrolase [Pyrinomonadaceae bacterium]